MCLSAPRRPWDHSEFYSLLVSVLQKTNVFVFLGVFRTLHVHEGEVKWTPGWRVVKKFKMSRVKINIGFKINL